MSNFILGFFQINLSRKQSANESIMNIILSLKLVLMEIMHIFIRVWDLLFRYKLLLDDKVIITLLIYFINYRFLTFTLYFEAFQVYF